MNVKLMINQLNQVKIFQLKFQTIPISGQNKLLKKKYQLINSNKHIL